MKDKKKTIDMGPMHYRVHVILTDDVVGAREKLNRKLGEYDGELVVAMHAYREDDAEQSYIILPHDANAGLIAHESFHCIKWIFECMNAEMEEEIFAYALQFLVKAVVKLQATQKKNLEVSTD